MGDKQFPHGITDPSIPVHDDNINISDRIIDPCSSQPSNNSNVVGNPANYSHRGPHGIPGCRFNEMDPISRERRYIKAYI